MFRNTIRQTIFLAKKLKKLYDKMCHTAGKPFGLSGCEIDVLLFLANNEGRNTAADIAKYRGISKALVSHAVVLLSAQGYITTRVDEVDRRQNRLFVAEEASKAIEELRKAQDEFTARINGVLSTQEIEMIEAVVARLSSQMDCIL